MKDEEHCEKTMFCAYNSLSLAKKSVIAYVTSVSYRSVTSVIDCRGMNLTLSQSKSPCLDQPICLPVIVLSFKTRAPLTGFYPLPLGETGEKKKNKSKEKRKRKHTEQTLVLLFTFCWGYRPSSFLYLLQSSIHFHALPFYLLKNKEIKRERYSSYRRKHNYLVFRNQMEAEKVQLM